MAIRVAVVYHIWPHYREAVAVAMDRSPGIAYSFFGSGEPFLGVKHADTSRFLRFVHAPHRYLGRVLWQPNAVRAALSRDYDAIIYLGDPNFGSTWLGAAIARMRGIPVMFWAHGWRRPERGAKRMIRNLFFRLSNRLLVYGERAKRLGAEAGFPDERITVVYNSLDVERADAVVAAIEDGTLADAPPQSLFADPARPLAICTARLITSCRFDLLIEAAAALAARGRPLNVLLIGDGPERAALEALAIARGVTVHFYGACYEEAVTGQMIYHADLTVSPGKIGLAAMHSLMYGTPAITHGNLDEQMPEVEALEEGVTGGFSVQDDAASLADAIERWLATQRDRATVRAAARAMVHHTWNPDVQARIIAGVICGMTTAKQRAEVSVGREGAR